MSQTIVVRDANRTVIFEGVVEDGIVLGDARTDFHGVPLADVRALCRLRGLDASVTPGLPLFAQRVQR